MITEKFSHTLYWQIENMRGRAGIKKRLNYLNETQYLSPNEIKKIQLNKLNSLMHHAYKTVPYYQRIFSEFNLKPDDINCTEDLEKLPLLTREILLNHQEELISSHADFSTLKVNSSSGSTGRRAVFKQDENFRLWMRAHQLRTYQWCNQWDVGQKFILLWGSEIYWSAKSFQDKCINFFSNRREFNTFRLSSDTIKSFISALSSFDPVLISSYANALYLIAMEAEKQGLVLPSLKSIQTTSEPMPPVMRKRIEHVFHCDVFDKYGSRETNIVSHESPTHDGMLIQSENVVTEFLNHEGKACQSNETGKVVLTTLNNFSMPLIRYETSDLATPLAGYSSCGFGFPRMSPVSGRKQDLIYTPEGDYIDSYFFSYLFMQCEKIHWFQVVQHEYESLEILIFSPVGIELDELNKMQERIHHHTGYRFKIYFHRISDMPESPTGKFRLCVSKLKESQAVTKAIGDNNAS